MKKVRKPSPTESPPLFEIDPEPIPETLTALGGVPLLVQTFRSLGLPAQARAHFRIKERDRGYDEATMVENVVILRKPTGDAHKDLDFRPLLPRPRHDRRQLFPARPKPGLLEKSPPTSPGQYSRPHKRQHTLSENRLSKLVLYPCDVITSRELLDCVRFCSRPACAPVVPYSVP